MSKMVSTVELNDGTYEIIDIAILGNIAIFQLGKNKYCFTENDELVERGRKLENIIRLCHDSNIKITMTIKNYRLYINIDL